MTEPTKQPFAIFKNGNRYLIYDAEVFMHARRNHHICGVLIGNIPSANQQNIFSGIPLHLLPEEARLLAEGGFAYVVNDDESHADMLRDLTPEQRAAYRKELEEEGLSVASTAQKLAEENKIRGLRREATKKNAKAKAISGEQPGAVDAADDNSLFSRPESQQSTRAPERELIPQFLTPTTSYPPLPMPTKGSDKDMPPATPSYPLFRHLHKHDYWMTPGLRFGCQFSVYPGDPLRFHSHFLATSLGWDEEIDLMNIVGGGRLGTGVKKSFLVGGSVAESDAQHKKGDDDVRVFSIEWAAM